MNIKFYIIEYNRLIKNYINDDSFKHIANIKVYHKNRVRRFNSEL